MSLLALSDLCYWFLVFKRDQANKTSHHESLKPLPFVQSNFMMMPETSLLERPVLMAKIQEKLKGQEGIQTLALVGVGGSGKTTLAQQVAHQQKASVVWKVATETQETLMESFETLAEALSQTQEDKKIFLEIQEIKNTQKRKEKIIVWVRQKLYVHSNWFLIFDNVEKFIHIQDYFPTDSSLWGRGKVILTTTDSNIKNNQYITDILQIGELTEREKLILFNKIMDNREKSPLTAEQKEEAGKFLKEIPSFPLDVSLAVYYLKATNVPYFQYLSYLKASSHNFTKMQENILEEKGNSIKTRYSIVTVSLQRIMETHKDFRDLLVLIGLLDCHDIPRMLLDAYRDPVVIDNFIYHLKKYSFITHEFSPCSIPTFSIHRSTQEIISNYLIKNLPLGKDSPQLDTIVNVLDHYIADAIEQEDFSTMKTLVNHCEAFLTHGSLLSDITSASIRADLGCIYYYLSDYTKAKQLLEESFPTLDKNYERRGRALVYLGNVYRKLGQYEKARVLLEQSLIVYQKHSLFSIGTAHALGYLGIVYRNLGNFKKATHFMEQSLTLYKQASKATIGHAWILAHLGNTHTILGQYEKAITLLEQSLSIYRKKSEKYVGAGWVLGYLGNAYRKIGQYEKATNLLEQSLIIHRKHFSKNHVYIAASLAYLGNVYKDLGNHEKARNLLEESLTLYQKTYGEDHIETARVLNNLGQVYLLEGRQDASEHFMKRDQG